MNYLPEINRAKRVKGFILAMRFNDGTEKHTDISQWFKGPVFKALKDPKFFAQFFVEAALSHGQMGSTSRPKRYMTPLT